MITTEEVNLEQNANDLETKAAEVQEIQEIDKSEHKINENRGSIQSRDNFH
jgi:hypothetical protein